MPHESFAFMLSLAAMAGIPPLVGFIVKLNIFYLLVQSGYVITSLIAVCLLTSAIIMGFVRAMRTTHKLVRNNYTVLGMAAILVIMGIIPQSILLQLTEVIARV